MLDIRSELQDFQIPEGSWLVSTQANSARAIEAFIGGTDAVKTTTPIDPTTLGSKFADELNSLAIDSASGFIYSGQIDRRSIMTAISIAKTHLADQAILIIDNADVMSVYEGIRESILADAALVFETLHIETDDLRPGRGLAIMTLNRSRTRVQDQASIPANKNRTKEYAFRDAEETISASRATEVVEKALSSWEASSREEAERWKSSLDAEFPDQSSPTGYWHESSDQDFVDFFTWGHDHNFGFGQTRQGAMSTRHIEIVSESVQHGFIDADLSNKDILNVGCWTGGDLLALAGMGANMIAIEEHKGSAAAAARLCELVGANIEISSDSLYSENENWAQRFDMVYISGVIYHVTDPLLALRICFSYLKPGGTIVVETKASSLDGCYCEYAGTLEKGWNWYAPTKDALGRWLADAGFPTDGIELLVRANGRLLAAARKADCVRLPEKSGFSRPGSWLESTQ